MREEIRGKLKHTILQHRILADLVAELRLVFFGNKFVLNITQKYKSY